MSHYFKKIIFGCFYSIVVFFITFHAITPTAFSNDIIYDPAAIEAAKERGYMEESVISISHRGYSRFAPENTLPAFQLAVENGFKYIETDIMFTSDGVAVLSHDDIINRTARLKDGSLIPYDIRLSDITYSQAMEYDYGCWFSDSYYGTALMTFEEFISFCKNNNVVPVIELKWNSAYTKERIENLYRIAQNYLMDDKIFWIGFFTELDSLQVIKDLDPDAHFLISADDTTLSFHNMSYSDFTEILSDWKTSQNTVYAGTDFRYLSEENLNIAKMKGLQIIAWTINNPEDLSVVRDNVIGYMTDCLNEHDYFNTSGTFDFTIDYELHGGSVNDNPVTYNEDTDTFSINNPVKNGYTFLGWTGSGITGISDNITVPKGTKGDLYFEALWVEAVENTETQTSVTGISNTVFSVNAQDNPAHDSDPSLPSKKSDPPLVLIAVISAIVATIIITSIVLFIKSKKK